MKPMKTFLLTSAAACLAILIAVAGAFVYLNAHPEIPASWIGSYLSSATGLTVQVEKLSYSLKPMRVRTGTVRIRSALETNMVRLDVDRADVRMHLEGPWGDRRLMVDSVRIEGLSGQAGLTMPALPKFSRPEDLFGRLRRGLIAFFLFREVRIEEVNVSGKRIDFVRPGQYVQAEHIEATRGADGKIVFTAALEWSARGRNAVLSAPRFSLATPPNFSFAQNIFSADLTVRGADLMLSGAAFHDISVETEGRFDFGRNTLSLARLIVTVPDVIQAVAKLEARLGSDRRIELSITKASAKAAKLLSALPEKFSARLPSGYLPEMISVKGTAVARQKENAWTWSATVDASVGNYGFSREGAFDMSAGRSVLSAMLDNSGNPAGRIDYRLHLTVGDLHFQHANDGFTAEGVEAKLTADGSIESNTLSVASALTADISKGEMLYDLYYFDFSKTPLFASGRGAYDGNAKTLALIQGKTGLKNIFTVLTSGNLRAGFTRGNLTLRLPPAEVSRLFDTFVKEPFGKLDPTLTDLRIGGAVSADIALSMAEPGWTVRGGCRWRDGRLADPAREIAAENIELDWPVWLQRGDAGAKQGERSPSAGRISIDRVAVPPLPPQSLQTTLRAPRPNRLETAVPISVQVPGGRLEIGTVTAGPIFSRNFEITTSLHLNSTDLSPFLNAFWPRPVTGSMKGKLDSITFRHNTVRSSGRLTASIFGGLVTISDPGVEGLFSSTPIFKLSAEMENIDLGRLTRNTSFGKITGLMKGDVKDLEIADGQPQHFEGELETVKRKGVPQKISIEAIDNIARIGGGQSPFVGFAGLMSSFFETLGYDKIGVRASLKNDYFRINGTIHENGTEFIMKRGGLSGVNIVNQNPDNRIRFKDMVNRIQRVTSGSQPVVR